MLRPIIVYEYLLIPILIVFNTPVIVTYIYFLVILFIDVISQISFIFLFSVPEFIQNLQFSLLYDFTITHYLLLFGFCVFGWVTFLMLKGLSVSRSELRFKVLRFMTLFFILTYGIDSLNGKSLLNERKVLAIYDFNLGAALSRDVLILFKDLNVVSACPKIENNSIALKTFKNDSSANQLIIIMESWGLPKNENDWGKLKRIVMNRASSHSWNFDFGTTKFDGSTVHSELRELFSATGDYRYLLNRDSAKSLQSIFDLKKKQGYTTYSIHSFSGRMFQRGIWWKNIGIDSAYFLEDIIHRKKLDNNQLNYTTPFPSLNDEEAFLFVGSLPDPKKFAYFLTVNTHLPFNMKTPNENIQEQWNSNLSDEARNQLNRIVELLTFFTQKSANGDWSTILIVGDHMPPFSNKNDREFYSSKKVPYLILSR